MIRILHVASGDLWAGAESQLFQLVRALSKKPDSEVAVVLFNEGALAARLREEGVSVWIIDESKASLLQQISALNAICKKFAPDVIHTHRFKENILGAFAARQNRVSCLVRTLHGKPEQTSKSLKGHVISLLDRLATRLCKTLLVAVSTETEMYAATQFPNVTSLVIANGIDVGTLRNSAITEQPNLVAGRGCRVCFVGRFTAVKRVDIFIAMAAKIVESKMLEVQFFLAGDGPLLPAAVAQATDLGLADQCRFLGFVPDAVSLMKEMDVLVITSDHEGLPMVALEALCVGVPVVSHAVGGLVDLIENSAMGTLVAGSEPKAYAAALLERLHQECSERRRDRANLLPESYWIQTTCDLYLSAYRTHLAGSVRFGDLQ